MFALFATTCITSEAACTLQVCVCGGGCCWGWGGPRWLVGWPAVWQLETASGGTATVYICKLIPSHAITLAMRSHSHYLTLP